ncbi:MAG: RNA polymerase sigma factor [bacterium]|nr:RNA polymerase sigma factor [bacterium]
MIQGGVLHMLLTQQSTQAQTASLSDEEVLAQSVDSPSLFEELVRRYQDAFLRKATSIIRDRRLAEDIVQESFTKIYLHATTFADTTPGSVKAWSYTIVTNTALTYYKKQKRIRDHTADLTAEHYESLGDDSQVASYEADVVKDAVASVLVRLPSATQRILSKVYLQDRPHKEIAEEEDVSVQVVKTRVHRARNAFKKIFDSME